MLSANKPNVTTFAPDFEAPRAWRGSLGVQRRILQRYTVNVDAMYARGVNYYGVSDLNLNTAAPQFLLSNEGQPAGLRLAVGDRAHHGRAAARSTRACRARTATCTA